MANTVRGKILAIEPIQTIPSKKGGNPYETRRLLLDATRFDALTGERGQENFLMFDFGGERNIHVPDNFKRGDIVEVYFRLRGNKYTKQGETKPSYFLHAEGYKIEHINVNGNQQQAAAPSAQSQQDAPQENAQQTAAPSQQAPQNNGTQAPQKNGDGQGDDLPF